LPDIDHQTPSANFLAPLPGIEEEEEAPSSTRHKLIFWRRCRGGSRRLMRGEFFVRTSFTLLLFCFTLFILPALLFYQKPKKIRILGSCYFFTLVHHVDP
jgi:hypothetical protein